MKLLFPILIVGSITFLSRILGFIRDTLIARTFGVSIMTDAFFVALKIPNFIRSVFAEGTFSQIFVPILIRYRNEKGKLETGILISNVLAFLILILIFLSFFGVLLAPLIVKIIAPGFINTPERLYLTIKLLRITFPYIFFVSISSFIGSILNSCNKFFFTSFSQVIFNTTIIIFLLIITPLFNTMIVALSWGVIFGGFLQLIYYILLLRKANMFVIPKIYFKNFDVFNFLKKTIPVILGASAVQISSIINTMLASFFSSGSISWMYYSNRLVEVPSGILGYALSAVLLPSLSLSFVEKNIKEYNHLLNLGLRLCFILAIPSFIVLLVLSQPLIIVLFQYGQFSSFDVLMTQKSLICYSLSLINLLLIKVLTIGFYSRQDTKTPVTVSFITLIITQIINFLFIKNLDYISLSISISISSYFNSIVLYWILYRKKFFIPQKGWCLFLYRLIISSLIMLVTLLFMLKIMPDWYQGNMFYRLFNLIYLVLSGVSVYLLSLYFLGIRINNSI